MSNFETNTGNGLSVIPQSITMYPGDKQEFFNRGAKIPALWNEQDGGSYESDYTVLLPGDGQATGLYRLEAETGQVTMLLDERNMQGDVSFRVTAGNLDDIATALIGATDIEVIVNGVSIDTISHVRAAGDRIAWEITGSNFYLELNGERIFTHLLVGEEGRYPVNYSIIVDSATESSIVPLILEGDWRPALATWTINPAEGELSTPGAGTTPPIIGPVATWIAPNKPTTYLLSVVAGDDPQANAHSRIHIPTLRILGARTLEVDPLEIIRFQTNYAKAQRKDLLTWTADGGTFDINIKGKYEAPEAPGEYTIVCVATYDGIQQFDEVKVKVRKVFYPRNICAVEPDEEIELYTNLVDPQWTATDGEVEPDDTAEPVYTAPGVVGREAQICVTDGTPDGTLCQDITVLEAWPIEHNIPYEQTYGADMLIEKARDRRTVWARQLSEDGFTPEEFPSLVNFGCDMDQLNDLKAFHDRYWKSQQPFFIKDAGQERRVVVRATSPLKIKAGNVCDFDISFSVEKCGCPF